jgi:hypothetical protein
LFIQRPRHLAQVFFNILINEEGRVLPKENERRRSTRAVLPITYYERLLKQLLDGLKAGLSYVSIAITLNRSGITTPTDRRWTGSTVKNTLKSLRHPDRYPSRVHRALVELLSYDQLSQSDAKLFYEQRII